MKQLLIIDDQEIFLKSLEFALKNKFKISVATNYKTVLNKLQNLKIDLVLSDIGLDEKDANNADGLKILEWIKINKSNIPVFIMSAYRELHYIETALKLGAEYFFKKPIEIMNLIKIMEEKS